jgi:glutathione S-transferase
VTLTLYDAPRCPYCARARIALAEKGVEVETVVIDLDDRPDWIYQKNATGRVPVLEEGSFLLPESAVILEYLEQRFPEPALLPIDADERALVRLRIFRFDSLSTPYYKLRRGDEGARQRLEAALSELNSSLAVQPYLSGDAYGLADVAYVPWVLRLPQVVGIELVAWPSLADWIARLLERPAVAAEADVVARL